MANTNLPAGASDLFNIIAEALVDAIKAEQEGANPGNVVMSMTREAYEEEKKRRAAQDTEIATLRAQLNLKDKALQEANHSNATLRKEVQRLRIDNGMLRSATQNARVADLNKLQKNYTACKNQRDSFQRTIAADQRAMAELREEIGRLKKAHPNTVPVIIIDSVPFDETEIRKLMATSIDAQAKVNQMTAERDAARKELASLKQTAHIYTLNGRTLAPEEVKGLMEIGYAAQQGLMPNSAKFVSAVKEEVYQHNHRVNTGRDVITITDPHNVAIRLVFGPNTQDVRVDADMIPVLVTDVQNANRTVEHLKQTNTQLRNQNATQAASIRSQDEEIERLRKRERDCLERINSLSKDNRILTTERNLMRGRAASKTTINGQVLNAGESYMTTCLGLLPIDANGMRKLSDTLDKYRAKMAKLTKALQDMTAD